MEIVFRAVVMFAFLWIVLRAIGRRELSELSAFDLVLLITMGDLIQQGVTQEDNSVTGAMLAVGTFALLAVAFSYITFRFRPGRRLIEGVPVVVIRDGRVLHEMMKLERLDANAVREAARQQGIEDLADVKLGIVEPDGQFSFIKFDGEQQTGSERQTKG